MLAGKGYSVIPVRGDLSTSEPKKPAMKWRAFQDRIADGRELETMFDARAGALAVVCGQVSQLLVIDFDDHLRYQQFCRRLPKYAGSYTVKTRRGYHIYFRTGVKVPSHQFEGGDIKGEKSYVVAAPSVIAGFEYRAARRAQVKALDEKSVDEILKYFHVGSAPGVGRIGPKELAGEADIAAMYERMYEGVGRNNTLYRCASVGFSQGMSRSQVERSLLRLHVLAQAPDGHKVESMADRYREGKRTIASASEGGGMYDGDRDGVPNTVRERLLAAQQSAVLARLLDSMFIAGWVAESFFNMGDAIQLGKRFGLGEKA